MTRLCGRVAVVCLAGLVLCSACGETDVARAPSMSGPTPLSLAPLTDTPLVMLGQEVGARYHESSRSGLSRTITTVVLTALHRGATGIRIGPEKPQVERGMPGWRRCKNRVTRRSSFHRRSITGQHHDSLDGVRIQQAR